MISKCSTSDKKDHREKWHSHIKRSDDGQILRRMVEAPVPGKRREEDRKPGGKTRVKKNMDS